MKALFKTRKFRSRLSTVLGVLVAIATAWTTIEWSTFDWSRDYMKLVLSAVIAIGGVVTRVKSTSNENQVDTPN